MYRILIIVLLNVVATFGCQPPPCHWKRQKEAQIINYFEAVARKVIDADTKAEAFCNKQGAVNVIEVHDVKEYKLIIPDAGGVNYELKVRGRVLQIVSENCQNFVTDLRILPPYVNGYSGYYYSTGSDLEVYFSYKYNPATGGGTCQAESRNIVTLFSCTYYNTCPVY